MATDVKSRSFHANGLSPIQSAAGERARNVGALTSLRFDTDNVMERLQEPGDEAMHLTISLDEPLAEQLRRQAFAKDVSPEQAASELLGHALHQIAEEEAWSRSNQRRAELIQKNRRLGLTAEEGRELDRLQAALDQRLEATDRQLLGAAEEFRQLAERLPDATEP
jgi:hypothetical protein